jgi:PHP domain
MAHVGILHVHSNLSYDGQNTLAEIASLAKSRGYQFVGMSEHSDTFEPKKMAYLVDECRRLSDASFLMIPGLEFTCDNRLHLLGLGIDRFTDVRHPALVARFVKAQGGLAILSHPSRYGYQIPSGLEMVLDGIEVWNAGYDGRFIPNDRSIRLWKSLRARNQSLCAFGSQDLHAIGSHRHVRVDVRCEPLTRDAILESLKGGSFLISNSYVRLRPDSSPGWTKLHAIRAGRRAYLTAKAIRDRLARWLRLIT